MTNTTQTPEPVTARNLRLPAEMGERLRLEAFQTRRPQSAIIRDALAEHFARLDRAKAK